MKVWMFIWSYWPGPQGGAERQCRLICPFLVGRKVDCKIITARLACKDKGVEKDGEVHIRRLGLFIPFVINLRELFVKCGDYLSGLLKFRANSGGQTQDKNMQARAFWVGLPFIWVARLMFIAELGVWCHRNHSEVDVIHAHETGWLGALAVIIGKIYQIPVFCKAATYPVFPKIGWDVPLRSILCKCQSQCDLIVLNEQIREKFTLDGLSSHSLTVIPNAVHFPRLAATPSTSDSVLYVGNFSQGAYLKAFDVLFEAWAIVHQTNRKLKLVVAGAGDVSVWKTYLRNMECESSVNFVGYVNNPEILYREAGLFVLPSRVEGMSNALLEALSFGLPVIASDILANQAVLGATGCGRLVEVGNVQALADAILSLMASPEERAQMGESARKLVELRYHPDTVSQRLVSLYHQKMVQNANSKK